MNYPNNQGYLKDVHRHLRNKNMDVFPLRVTFADRSLAKISRFFSRLIIRSMYKKGYELIVSEQIVENSLILQNIHSTDKEILDFGGYESLLPLQLASIGHNVTVLDQRRYPFHHPNLDVLCDDLFSDNLRIDKQFDLVISISTIEHLGLGAYNDALREGGDREGIERLWKYLRKGGRLMASVPAGKPVFQRGYRVYDEKRLQTIFPSISSVMWYMKEGREGTWHRVEFADTRDLVYCAPSLSLPVEAIAFVICEKPADETG